MKLLKSLGATVLLLSTVGLALWAWDEGGYWRLAVGLIGSACAGYAWGSQGASDRRRVEKHGWESDYRRLYGELGEAKQRVKKLERQLAQAQVEAAGETFLRWPR